MTIREKILVIEDEKSISHFISTVLNNNGYEAMQAQTGEEALSMISSHCPDLVILDLGLTDMDGLDILRSLRSSSSLPVVVVSARSHHKDKVSAQDLGADDYLTKPIKMKLLVSRVQAILKRIDADRPPEKAPAPGLTVDRERYTVIRDGQEITLPRKEFALLDLLHSSPGKLIPREEIYAKIWGTEVVVGDRTIDVHIRKLRQKIGDERIVTVKGVGYKYEP